MPHLFLILFFNFDEINISQINEQTRCLAENEHRVLSVNGVNKERDASGQGKIPECPWDDAFLLFFRSKPLDKKSHEKKELPEKAHAQPALFGC